MIVTSLGGQSEFLTDYQITERKRVVNGEYSLPFILFKTTRNSHSFDLVQEESIVEYDGQKYRIKKLREYTKGKTPVKEATTQHIIFDIIDDYQYDTISGTTNIMQALNHVFGVTEWTWINHGAFAPVEFDKFGDGTALELFKTILERFGAEFEITGEKEITLKNQIGTTRDAQFRYRHNIKTLYKNIDSSNVSTYIRGFGKDVTAEYTSPNVSVYGIRHAPPVRDEKFTTQASLLEHLQKVIVDTPDIVIEIEIVELKKQGIPIHEYDLGDTIYLIHEDLGIDATVRILEYTDYPESLKSPTVVLANFKKNITSALVNFHQTSKTIKQLTDADGNLSLQLKKLYRNSDHYSDSTGDWFIAPDDANAYVHIGAGGLDVHKGLVRVERDDGYAVIVGGKIQNGFNIQGAYPPFRTAGVGENGPWVYVATTNRYENIQSFTFKHDSRYLIARVGMYSDNQINGFMSFDLDTSDGNGTSTTTLATVSRASNDINWTTYVTMDLGVPTGNRKTLYVRLYGANADWNVHGRILYISQEG
ncbi:phage tail protein [Bacillus sp. AFS037270]|uniref:phage tail protein n=1 Tax=Bacillus sp. AFS037270 TaxID=2033499 RepID=UPI00159B8AB6|nr:phage tail protein [Bacillus sp. AFS037270]